MYTQRALLNFAGVTNIVILPIIYQGYFTDFAAVILTRCQ